MALDQGSVTVDSSGNATGSGLALVLYNAKVAAATAAGTLSDPNNPPKQFIDAIAAGVISQADVKSTLQKQRINDLQGYAIDANAFSTVAPYITNNAFVTLGNASITISTSTSVGAMPSSTVPGTPIAPPPNDVVINVDGFGAVS